MNYKWKTDSEVDSEILYDDMENKIGIVYNSISTIYTSHVYPTYFTNEYNEFPIMKHSDKDSAKERVEKYIPKPLS